MKTGYKTSKAPYEDIHYGDIVERYKGSGLAMVVWRPLHPFTPMLKPMTGDRKPYPILKVDRIASLAWDFDRKRKYKKQS